MSSGEVITRTEEEDPEGADFINAVESLLDNKNMQRCLDLLLSCTVRMFARIALTSGSGGLTAAVDELFLKHYAPMIRESILIEAIRQAQEEIEEEGGKTS